MLVVNCGVLKFDHCRIYDVMWGECETNNENCNREVITGLSRNLIRIRWKCFVKSGLPHLNSFRNHNGARG